MLCAMTAVTALVVLVALAVGMALGWWLRSARGDVELARAGERLAASAAGEEADRRSLALYAGLTEQVAGMHRASRHLASQTDQLVTALRAPQIRGRWGEMQLERVVELAGMTRHCDFDTQVVGDGVRPDLVVRLAGGRSIVVDAKVPLVAFLDAAAETDPETVDRHLERHARHLRTHVDALADKKYWRAFDPSPEFVVLFVPGDPFLDAALTRDRGLLEHAFTRNVVLATPTTLVALLRTVAFTCRQGGQPSRQGRRRVQHSGRFAGQPSVRDRAPVARDVPIRRGSAHREHRRRSPAGRGPGSDAHHGAAASRARRRGSRVDRR